jgi:hypothetical protein
MCVCGCVCACVYICMCVGGRDRMFEPITPFSSFSFIFVFSCKKFPYFLSTVSSFFHSFSFISFSFRCYIIQISFFHLIIFNSELHVCVCLCVCFYISFWSALLFFFLLKSRVFFFFEVSISFREI